MNDSEYAVWWWDEKLRTWTFVSFVDALSPAHAVTLIAESADGPEGRFMVLPTQDAAQLTVAFERRLAVSIT